jgi:hypothetical protein
MIGLRWWLVKGLQMPQREWMGVEPTKAASAAPPNGFEDRGAHRDSTTPTMLQG